MIITKSDMRFSYAGMSEIYIFLKHSGTWVEPTVYVEGGNLGIMVSSSVNYPSLMQILFAELGLSPSTHRIGLKYLIDGACKPVEIKDNGQLKAYLYLRKTIPDVGRFHMILEISEEPREGHEAAWESVVSPGFRSTPNTVEPTQGLEDMNTFYDATEECRESPPRPPRQTPPTPPPPRRESPPPPPPCRESHPPPPPRRQSAHPPPPHPSSDEQVLDINSPVTLKLHGMYASKLVLQKQLSLYAINKHCTFRTKYSSKECLHVVCPGEHCKWSVRAVRIPSSPIFRIKR